MKEFRVDYDIEAEADIIRLRDWLLNIGSRDLALKYLQKIRLEVARLSYTAEAIPESEYQLPKLYHPHAKITTVGNRKLIVIFHIDGDYAVVDKILPSSLITY
ncbi:MAG: hypothetical protein IJU81_07980 [Bacteroidales bacterium]|nr:hypothetical protein [Bacteroidales bacterium]